jgi:hypothetical protein
VDAFVEGAVARIGYFGEHFGYGIGHLIRYRTPAV